MAAVTAVLASANPGKARELERLLPDWTLEPLEADYPPETGATYRENALLKARFARRLAPPDAWVLADDSGIELEALGGGPGVDTAPWAGGDLVGRLLAALEGAASRRARYVCELVAVAPDGREVHAVGTLAGRIAHAPRGSTGFGSDPVFVPDGEERTVAELGEDWKDVHSHRADAARRLVSALSSDAGARPS